MTLRTPVIAGNWKMHVAPAEAADFLRSFLDRHPPRGDRTVALFPPSLSLAAASEAARGRSDLLLGVQNVHWESRGAFTGEISAAMAASAGARLVLVGHSERRHVFSETDEETGRKVKAALGAGLLPVLCVGELLEERERGEAAAVVSRQLDAGLRDVAAADAHQTLIAYEPVWAIGTGKTATPADASELHRHIRQWLERRWDASGQGVPILYGGSVKAENAGDLLSAPDVDGLLVGGASLDPEGFARICAAG